MAFRTFKTLLTWTLMVNLGAISNAHASGNAECEPNIHLNLSRAQESVMFLPKNKKYQAYFSADIGAAGVGLPADLQKYSQDFDFIMVVNKDPRVQRAYGFYKGVLRRMMPVSTGSEHQILANSISPGIPARDTFTQTPTGFHTLDLLEWNHKSGLFPLRDPDTGKVLVDDKSQDPVGTPMPYSAFFAGGAASHETHGDPGELGTDPMSGGCVRMSRPDARWAFMLARTTGGPLTEAEKSGTDTVTIEGQQVSMLDYVDNRLGDNYRNALVSKTATPTVPVVNSFTGETSTRRTSGYRTLYVVINQAPPGQPEITTAGQMACSGGPPPVNSQVDLRSSAASPPQIMMQSPPMARPAERSNAVE
jgi:hypothetical protein